jgi:hypothetical protein
MDGLIVVWTKVCSKCKVAESQPTYPVAYPEDDGTISTDYGCDQCIDDMWDMAAARKEG